MTPGHNSGGAAAQQIRSFVDRVERLHEERDALGQDLKEVYAEAKGAGFCTRTLKKVIQRRRLDREERIEQDELLELYERALEGASETRAPAPLAAAREGGGAQPHTQAPPSAPDDVGFLAEGA